MSHHPVETRLREVVENCSMQVQQKIAASQHTPFKSSRFCLCHLVLVRILKKGELKTLWGLNRLKVWPRGARMTKRFSKGPVLFTYSRLTYIPHMYAMCIWVVLHCYIKDKGYENDAIMMTVARKWRRRCLGKRLACKLQKSILTDREEHFQHAFDLQMLAIFRITWRQWRINKHELRITNFWNATLFTAMTWRSDLAIIAREWYRFYNYVITNESHVMVTVRQ